MSNNHFDITYLHLMKRYLTQQMLSENDNQHDNYFFNRTKNLKKNKKNIENSSNELER